MGAYTNGRARQLGFRGEASEACYSLFEEHWPNLYWLAFLLTGDREQGVRAVADAIDLACGNSFPPESVDPWARDLVVVACVTAIHTRLRDSILRTERLQRQKFANLDVMPSPMWSVRTTTSELQRALLSIDVFPRCALILTVFEQLPNQEVAFLLDADKKLVRAALAQGAVELTRNLALNRGWNPLQVVRRRALKEARGEVTHV